MDILPLITVVDCQIPHELPKSMVSSKIENDVLLVVRIMLPQS